MDPALYGRQQLRAPVEALLPAVSTTISKSTPVSKDDAKPLDSGQQRRNSD
jgi:hypothetical protein